MWFYWFSMGMAQARLFEQRFQRVTDIHIDLLQPACLRASRLGCSNQVSLRSVQAALSLEWIFAIARNGRAEAGQMSRDTFFPDLIPIVGDTSFPDPSMTSRARCDAVQHEMC